MEHYTLKGYLLVLTVPWVVWKKNILLYIVNLLKTHLCVLYIRSNLDAVIWMSDCISRLYN